MAARFHAWHGRSGKRYLATVYAVAPDDAAAEVPAFGQAVLIAVARQGASRIAIGLVAIERDSDWTRALARLRPGADEWHVHFLGADRAARAAILADLGGGHRMVGVA